MNRLLLVNVLLTSSLLVSCTLAPFHRHSSTHPGLHGHTNRTDDGSSGSSAVTSASQTNHVGPSITTTATMATGRDLVRYTTAGPIDDCRTQPDNYAAVEPGSKCRRYFRCVNYSKSVYLCPAKLVFNGQRCVHPADYQCHNAAINIESNVGSLPPPEPIASPVETKNQAGNAGNNCDAKSDGYYQDGESGCRSYFYCASGMKAIYVCPAKAVFDGQRCVEPDTYSCPHSSSDCQLGATSVSNGYQADLNSGCHSYYFCSADGHKLITLTCADGRLFDGKTCVDPVHYRCPSDHVTTTEKPKTASASIQLDSYYSYSPPLPARKHSLSAVHPQQTFFVVSSRNSAATGRPLPAKRYCEKSYGFFAVAGTGCRHYYMCIGGSRSDLQCAGDTIFDGQLCVDPAQYTCPESIHTSDCQGKSDGVYPDRQSGCRNYFLCLAEVQTNLSCPVGQLFDGRRCTDSRRMTCNDPVAHDLTDSMQSPCAGKTNGLYLDHNFPGCRGYLYCRAGRPYGPSGRCTRSERFSGLHSRCLPKHEVECRSPSSVDDNEDEDYMMAEASAMLVTIITDDVLTATTPATN